MLKKVCVLISVILMTVIFASCMAVTSTNTFERSAIEETKLPSPTLTPLNKAMEFRISSKKGVKPTTPAAAQMTEPTTVPTEAFDFEVITAATAKPMAKATPKPTAKATAKATPKPTAKATPKPEYTVKDITAVKGYVNAGTVNLRKGPGTGYDIIEEYKKGASLTINGESGDWYRVKISSKTGFMLKTYVGKGTMPTPTPTPKTTPKPTAKATPKPASTPKSSGKYTEDEIYLTAQLVLLEGKGGTTEGFRAIAGVVLNRVNSPHFIPDTIEGVIFQKNQFSVAKNEAKLRSQKPSSAIINAVREVLNEGKNPLPSNVLFFRVSSAGKSWGNKEYYKTIDNNSFFKYM